MGVKFTPEVRAILQEKALKMFEENPYASFASVSKALGIHKARVWDWYSSNTDGFGDKYKKVLDVAFAELEAPAIATLGELIQEKNFQAVKYVLDGTGHKPIDKFQQVGDVEIKVSIEGEEENE